MIKYETVYSFNVIDEIRKGVTIYLIDKCNVGNSFAIVKASDLDVGIFLKIIDSKNDDNRYEFYKAVNVSEE